LIKDKNKSCKTIYRWIDSWMGTSIIILPNTHWLEW